MQINNLTNFKIDKKSFSQVAKKVLSGENRGRETLSLAFVKKLEIKKLNKKFRKKNSATDVLSFEGINEVVICPEVVKGYGGDFKKEILKVFVHGILHLCGYDHERSDRDAEVMKKKEGFYLSELKN